MEQNVYIPTVRGKIYLHVKFCNMDLFKKSMVNKRISRLYSADSGGRAVLQTLACWDGRFESRRRCRCQTLVGVRGFCDEPISCPGESYGVPMSLIRRNNNPVHQQ